MVLQYVAGWIKVCVVLQVGQWFICCIQEDGSCCIGGQIVLCCRQDNSCNRTLINHQHMNNSVVSTFGEVRSFTEVSSFSEVSTRDGGDECGRNSAQSRSSLSDKGPSLIHSDMTLHYRQIICMCVLSHCCNLFSKCNLARTKWEAKRLNRG